MLTPKILSLSFDPQNNAFIPGLTPMQYFTISLTAGSVENSAPCHWKASYGGHLPFKEILSPGLRIPLTTIICDASSSSEGI